MLQWDGIFCEKHCHSWQAEETVLAPLQMGLHVKDLQQEKALVFKWKYSFLHSACKTYSSQEHELIAERSRNEANMEVCSTVHSVVFSLHPPPSFKSDHWSQQSTVFFRSLLILSNLQCPKPCVYSTAPAGADERASVLTATGTLGSILTVISAAWDEETKVKSQGRKSIGFILVSWCWYGCQCFMERVHVARCVLYEFFIDLASVTVINSIFIQKCRPCQ